MTDMLNGTLMVGAVQNEPDEASTDSQLSVVEGLYNLLMTRASGRAVDDVAFATARVRALHDPALTAVMPSWIREVRSPRDWKIFADARFSGSKQTREWLRREFAPVFAHLEGFEVERDTSPIPGYGRAAYRYPGEAQTDEPAVYVPGKRVFLVHGHDITPRNAIEAYLRRLGLEPVVLSDQPSGGRTIIEKLEDHDDVDYAVIILTPDDVGGAAATPKLLQARARQNVILELGFFVGRLGRDMVAAVLVGDLELPSDVHGVAYIPYQEKNDFWKHLLVRELRHARMPLDLDAM